MKKFLSILLAILMIVLSLPMVFAETEFTQQQTHENGVAGYTVGDDNVPLTINMAGKDYIAIGEGTDYYDEDGYIITGRNEKAQIDVIESCDITLENAIFCTIYLIGNEMNVNITLEGESFCGSSENEYPGINIYNSHLVIDGGEDDSLTYNGLREMIDSSDQSATLTVNGGKIISNTDTDYNYGSIECNNFVINGGEVTLSTTYSHICESVLNGGVLNIVNTSSEQAAISKDVIMKKGALLTVSAEKEILSSWYGFDGYDAEIIMADGNEETDYFFVRYDETSEFTPVRDIRDALDGRSYAEIKIDTHVHSFDGYGCCICGNTCSHKNVTDNKCLDCGADGDLVIITMTDNFGDGWQDNAIVIEEFVGEESKEIGSATISSYEKNSTYITFFYDDYAYLFKWMNGYCPEECGFTVTVNGETVYEVSEVSLADGEAFLLYCKHSFENGKCTKCSGECGVDFEHNFDEYTCTLCGKYMYKIVHQPTTEELFVEVNNDSNASFQWCTVSYVAGEKVYTPVNGYTNSYLENPEGGTEYACIVTFEDGTTEISDSVNIHGCDFSGKWYSDGEKHWKECKCGNIGEEAAHSYDDNLWEYNEEGHQAKCKCGYKAAAEGHEFEDSVCIKCYFFCEHINFNNDLCEACGYRCRHEIMISEIITRPVQNDDGTWGKGSAKNICSLCEKDFSSAEVERDHEGYERFYEAYTNFEKIILGRDDIVEDVRNGMLNTLADLRRKAEEKVYTELEKDYIASLISNIEGMYKDLEDGLADGTMIKADFSKMKELLDEIAILIDGKADSILPHIYENYLYAVEYYNQFSADPNYSKFFYDFYGYEADLADFIAAIKDGSAMIADYTEIDKTIAEIEEKLNNENISDKAKTGLEKIKSQLREMKLDENSTAADVAQLEKALEEYVAEVDNCINGTHNGLRFEVAEEAACGKNAVEAADCTLCGETVTKQVENSALTHSFTKYETVEEAKCGAEGKAVAYCDNGCGETDENTIEALTHTDADGDFMCDFGCGYEFEKPADPDTPDVPVTPEEPEEPTDENCDHFCHKSGILGFFWKIVKFFSKLFKINPVCECGAAHY